MAVPRTPPWEAVVRAEKEGAFCSPVRWGPQVGLDATASNRSGALQTEKGRASRAGRPDKGAEHQRNREVGLFKKRKEKSVFEVLSPVEEPRCCCSLAGCEARTAQLVSDRFYSPLFRAEP